MGTDKGYFGRILHVDLTEKRTWAEPIEPESIRSVIGGWGLNAKLAYDHTQPGLDAVSKAKESGAWEQSPPSPLTLEMPEAFRRALAANPQAKLFFEQLAPGYRKQYAGWIASAKRKETRERRICEAVELLQQNRKLGMK